MDLLAEHSPIPIPKGAVDSLKGGKRRIFNPYARPLGELTLIRDARGSVPIDRAIRQPSR